MDLISQMGRPMINWINNYVVLDGDNGSWKKKMKQGT